MAWTNDQLKAIQTKGGKILVSAAAGSGKTAVLSERVLNNILSGTDIDKMLIVTFTEAAALEMKERIKNKLEEECLKQKDNTHLLNQLSLIEVAKITTMDSFYTELVKENFDKLGIMPNYSILSNAEEKLLKNKIVKKVLEESFNDPNYVSLLNTLNVNDTNLIKDKVIKIESFLSTIPFYKDCINDFISKYDGNYYKDLYIGKVKEIMLSYKKLYEDIENELYNSGIVDMSHRYPKMYVIRPQFFIPIITLLRNASLNSLELFSSSISYSSLFFLSLVSFNVS